MARVRFDAAERHNLPALGALGRFGTFLVSPLPMIRLNALRRRYVE